LALSEKVPVAAGCKSAKALLPYRKNHARPWHSFSHRVFNWGGIYIGGNGGYSYGTTTPRLAD
jgi:hypothetical protein